MFPIFSNTLVSQCLDLYFPQDLVSILPQPVIPMVKTDITNTLQPSPPIYPTHTSSYPTLTIFQIHWILPPFNCHLPTSCPHFYAYPSLPSKRPQFPRRSFSFFPTYLAKPQFWLNPTLAFTFLYYVSKHGGRKI